MNQSTSKPVEFRDRWTFGLWFFLLAMNASFAFALWAALDSTVALIAFAFLIVLTTGASIITPLRIQVNSQVIRVGSATLEREFIKKVETLDKSAMALRRTRNADPRAFLQLRFWINQGIEIQLQDPRDPHPYWLVSTKRGREIVEALKA